MKPTLFICIGGSGMKIGHALKYNYATYMPNLLLTQNNPVGKVKFLFIDNDVSETERIKPFYRHKQGVFNRDEFIEVGHVNSNRIVERIKKNLKQGTALEQTDEDINRWVDKKINFPDVITEIGLAASRQIGRIALATGYDTLYSKISAETTKLINIANEGRPGQPEPNSISIYIITGICGGTGSSMFLDISALIDNLLGQNESPNKKAVFINTNYYLEQKLSDPNINQTSDQYLNLQVNSVALVSECEFFYKNKQNNQTLLGQYTARNSQHENRVRLGYAYSPFSSAFLFDIYANNRKKIPLSKFFYVVADMLFYAGISQVSQTFEAYIETNTTVTGTGFSNKLGYNTLSLKVVQYPHEEFLDYFQKRYIYEIFSKSLLNKDLKGDEIGNKAKEFVKDVFEDPQASIFAGIVSDYKTYLPKYQNKDSIFAEGQYLNENGKLISKVELISTINGHTISISDLKDELEQKRKSLPELGFKSKYNTRATIADQLRRYLIKYTQEVILSHGFYGVLGLNEGKNLERGFLDEIDKILREKYVNITGFKIAFNEHELINNITRTRSALLENIGKTRVKLSYNDIKSDIDAYQITINDYIEQLFTFNISQVQQEILYYFSVGDQKADIVDSFYSAELDQNSTELTKYRKGLSLALGTTQIINNSNQSLLSIYDKGANDDSETIRNNFTKFLPNRWNATKDDLFTVYVPENLYNYTDSNSSDNWKSGTELDRKFTSFISIDRNELNSIFGDDPKTEKLLSMLGLDLDKINSNINLIKEKITSKFLEKYINDSTHPIAMFINKSIRDAYNDGTPEIQNKILDQKHTLMYPVCDPTNHINPDPYLNIHPDNREFAENQLAFDPNKIISQNEMPKHQLAFIGIIQDIDFHSITGNADNLQIYKDRNQEKFRPHLHADWNDYTYGPFDALQSANIQSDGDFTYKLSDAFYISFFFEKLIEKAPQIAKFIYVEKDRTLTTKNGKRSMPISFNTKNKIFSYYSEGEIIEENGIEKFFVRDDHQNPGGISLGKLFETLEFEKASKVLNKDAHFIECFTTFITVVREQKEEIANLIDNNINDLVSQEISDTTEKLKKSLSRFKGSVSELDKNFITNFSENCKILIDGLLEINLDL